MSDLKLWSGKKKKLLRPTTLDVKAFAQWLKEYGSTVLGLTIIANHYLINNEPNNVIEFLALDENKQVVVVEQRRGKYGQIIGKGLMHLDYIKERPSEFKLLVADAGIDPNHVTWTPRLLIIGDDFNEYDQYAIRPLPYPIELIKVIRLEDDWMLFEKCFVSKKTQEYQFHPECSESERMLFQELIQMVLSLGDEVVGTGIHAQYTFRKMKNFMMINTAHSLEVTLLHEPEAKSFLVKTMSDLDKLFPLIEAIYDAN